MIEEFSTFIAKNTGLNLSSNETLKLYVHYYNEETKRVNYDKLIADVKSNIKDQKLGAVGKFDMLDAYKVKEKKKTLCYDELIQVIYNRIESKIINLTGKDHLKKVYLLLSESRSPVVTRHQLKTACHSRLALFLKDADIDLIFNKLDVDRQGVVNIRLLISDIMKKEHRHDVTLTIGVNARPPVVKKTFDQNENEKARLTYDNKYVDLIEPNPDRCVSHSPLDIERIIRSKITERCTGSDNMAKTAYKLFMDGSHHKGDPRITLHHVQYTLWKKLRLNITAADVLHFYNNYDREGKGFIYMSVFLDGIIRQLDISEPLLEDKSHLSKSDRVIVDKKINESADLKVFFSAMRRCINDLVNRESRAPHYILHGTDKMTMLQAKAFFRQKLHFDIDSLPNNLFERVVQQYLVNGLFEIKTLILQAMSMEDRSDDQDYSLLNRSLLNGSLVSVDRMPNSLKQAKLTPEDIERVICLKCNERLKTNHPHASLHKIFRDSTSSDNRVITRIGMGRVLQSFDIIMDSDDFDRFFAKHDRGDGVIDIHTLLKQLLPPDNLNDNPYLPRDLKDARTETDLSNALRLITGKQRQIGSFNGVPANRLSNVFLGDLSDKATTPTAAAVEGRPAAVPPTRPTIRRPSSANAALTSRSPLFDSSKTNQSDHQQSPAAFRKDDPFESSVPMTRTDFRAPESTPTALSQMLPQQRPASAATDPPMTSTATNVRWSDTAQKQSSQPVDRTVYKDLLQGTLLHALKDLGIHSDSKVDNLDHRYSIDGPAVSEHHHGEKDSTATAALANYRAKQSLMLRELANAYDVRSGQPESAEPSRYTSSSSAFKAQRPSSAPPSRSTAFPEGTPSSPPPSPHRAEISFMGKGSYPRKGTFLNVTSPRWGSTEQKHFTHFYPLSNQYQSDTAQQLSPRSLITDPDPASTKYYRLQTTTVNGTTSPLKGSAASPRFVYTGQPRQLKVDPTSAVMMEKYRIRKGHTSTSHEEYGLFVKSIASTLSEKKQLLDRQRKQLLADSGPVAYY